MWHCTKNALFAVSVIFNAECGREQTEREHENEIAGELLETGNTSRKTLFEVLTQVVIDFWHFATLCGETPNNESFL